MPANRREFLSRAALSAGVVLTVPLSVAAAEANTTCADALRRIGRVRLIQVRASAWHSLQPQTEALDVALMAMHTARAAGDASPLPRRVSALESHEAVWDFGDWLLHVESSNLTSTTFLGEHGTLLITRENWTLHQPDGSSETRPFCHFPSVSNRGLSGTVVDLARISHQLSREIRFDPLSHSIPGDEAANALLASLRQSRHPLLTV